MTYKLILLLIKVNHCATYQHQMSFCLKIKIHTQTTNYRYITQPKWLVIT